jgi:hemerythrin
MGLITWHDYYSVNVQEIDSQHRKLIGLINRMYDAMKDHRAQEVMGTVLTELVEYTEYHFTAEEQLLQHNGYPEYEEHKQVHEALTSKARGLKQEFDQGNTAAARDVMLLLSNWLNVHILEVDRKYSGYLNSRGVT